MVTKTKTSSHDFIYFQIPRLLSALNKSSLIFFQSIRRTLSKQIPISKTIFLFVQAEPSDPADQSHSFTLLDEVRRNILYVRETIEALRALENQSVFIGKGHCVSLEFDLALACSHRIWFGRRSILGFPEIQIGLLPLGGSIDHPKWKKLRSLESWHKQPIIQTETAIGLGLIDIYCGIEYSPSHIEEWVDDNLILRHALRKKVTIETSDIGKFTCLDWIQTIEHEKSWLKSKRIDHSYQAWDYGIALTQTSKGSFLNSQIYENIFAMYSGRFLLDQGYVSLNKFKNSYSIDDAINTEKDLVSTLFIDCSAWAPPIEAISNLLLAKFEIVFYADDSNQLATILGRIHLKINRLPQKDQILPRWEKSVSWFVGVVSCLDQLTIKWTIEDTVEMSFRGAKNRYCNLAGNLIQSPLGVLESQTEEIDVNVSHITSVISTECQSITGIYQGFSVGCWTRLMFLQELIQLTTIYESDFASLLLALQSSNWGFIGQKELWQHFLQVRGNVSVGLPLLIMPNSEILDLAHWKQILALVHNVRSKKQNWNPKEINTHLALYTDTLTKYLLRLLGEKNDESVQTIVCSAIGFPSTLISPNHFANTWGNRRSQLYKKRFWSTLI